MKQVNIHEAKTHLSALLKAVMHGEDVVISKSGHPIARLVPFRSKTKKRILGKDKGKFTVPDDFDAPDTHIEELFYGNSP